MLNFTINLVLKTIWLLLPSYLPNNFAVIFGGGRPIDLGRTFIDNKRIFGDGKTFRGFFSGIVGGISIAIFQYCIEKPLNIQIYSHLNFQDFIIIASLLSLGSIFGDLIGSFIKRRIGIERGGKAPILDQLDFLIISLLMASLSPSFSVLFSFEVIVTAIVITPALHITTNFIAYKLGLKNVPW